MSITPERDAEVEVVARLEVELRRLAHLPQDLGVLLGLAVGNATGPAGSGSDGSSSSICSSTSASSCSRRLISAASSRIAAIASSASLACALGLARSRSETRFCSRAPLLDLGQELPPPRVELEQLVDLLGRPAPRERRLDALGIAADQLEVERCRLRSA